MHNKHEGHKIVRLLFFSKMLNIVSVKYLLTSLFLKAKSHVLIQRLMMWKNKNKMILVHSTDQEKTTFCILNKLNKEATITVLLS